MPYKTFGAGNVLTAADMNAVTADPVQADVATAETTASASYVDLATVGPTVGPITLVNGQKCLVYVSAFMNNNTDGAHQFMSFAVSGASTLSANDTNAAAYQRPGANSDMTPGRWSVFTATATGSHTFTAKYKTTAGTANYSTRRLIVKAG